MLADDHPIVRRGLRDILSVEPDVEICGEARDAAEALRVVTVTPCDLVILDLSLPDRHGLDVLAQITAQQPAPRVLVLTMHPETQFAVRAMRMGAAGYLTKDSAAAELVGAVRTIVRGGRYISPALADALVDRLQTGADAPAHERLSARELDVLLRIGAGQSPTQIASELHLSVKTISTYRARILDKLALTTTAELIHYVARSRLLG